VYCSAGPPAQRITKHVRYPVPAGMKGREAKGPDSQKKCSSLPGGINRRTPALLRRAFCAIRGPRPIYKSRRPGKVGTPASGVPPASCVAVPAPHPWRTKGEGLDEVARRALLALVGAPQILLDSCVGGAGVDEGRRVGARE
jgi:hypothetical protein